MNGGGGGMGGQDNSMMQDSASQAPSTNGLFSFGGASQPAPSASTNGFSFGQSSSTGFGGSSNVFGQPKTQEESKPAFSAGLFGSQPQSNGFTPAFGGSSTPAAPASVGFGSTPPPAPAPTFKFGETSVTESKSTTPEPIPSTTPKAKPSFSFGQPSSFSQSTLEAAPPASAPAKPLFSFGQPSSAPVNSQSTTTTPSKPLFGATSASSNPPEPATAPAKPLFNFGQPTSKPAEQAPITNPFGTPSKSTESAAPSTSLFGRASPAAESRSSSVTETGAAEESTEPEKPHNPFSGLFGAKPVSTQPDTPKPGFQFSKSDNNVFGSPAKQPEPAQAKLSALSDKTDKPQSLFGFPSSVPTSDNTSSVNSVANSSSNSLFNLNKPIPSTEPDREPAQSQTSSLMFSQTSKMNANAGSTPFKTFGQAPVEDAGPAKKKLFQSPTAAESMAQFASGQSEKAAGPTEPVQPKFTQPQRSQPAKETVTRAVSTEGPPQIPRYLSADKYKSYDENWRLKALNRTFKAYVSTVDPDHYDFLNVVQNYLDHRESIGEGLAHWIRKQTAGSKRKPDDVNDMQPEDESSKRSKSNSGTSTVKPAPTASSLFGSVPSPKPATSNSQTRASGSTTSTMFKSLIPGTASAPAPPQTSASLFSFAPAPTKSTTPPSSPPKQSAPQAAKFEVPKFAAGSVDFAGAFAKNAASSAEKAEKEAKAKRKAEDFDSDEDDEAEWEKKYEEEQKQKKAKLGSVAKTGFVPGFTPSASSTRSNSPFTFAAPAQVTSAPRSESQPISDSEKAVISIESDGEGRTGSTSGESIHAGNESGNSGDDEDDEEDEVVEEQAAEQEEDDEGEPIPDLPKGESLFDRISKPATSTKADDTIFGSAAKPYYKPAIMFDGVGKESPEQPKYSPFTPKGDFVPATSFNFTSTSASGPAFGTSLIKDGPIPGEGLFGSRPSTPQPGSAKESTSVFGSTSRSSAPANNTWTKGSPIKFGDSTADKDAPSIEVSAATPPGSKSASGSGFFGAASSSGGSVGFNFGSASSQPAPGYLAAAPHLASGGASGISSRGSSPGLLSEAESVNTDASTTQDEEHSNQPQISLMASNAGEENEDLLFEARAGLSRNYKKADLPENTKLTEGWNKVGTGSFKLLKNKDDGKCRIVFRAEPNANILLNARIVPTGTYNSTKGGNNGLMTFPVLIEKGMQMWMLRIKTKEQTDSLVELINENKAN